MAKILFYTCKQHQSISSFFQLSAFNISSSSHGFGVSNLRTISYS